MPRKSQTQPTEKKRSAFGHRPISKPKPKKPKAQDVMAELGAAAESEQRRLRAEFEQRRRKSSNSS